jgi:dimethyladenosine transferase
MDLYNINEIKALLSNHGFHFSKSMGQNFIIDSSVPEKIAELSSIDDSCGVVEIGPGIGSLTVSLASRAKKVVSIELDKSLLPLLKDTLSGYSNVEIINKDALKTNFKELVDEKLSGLKPTLCANIPYNITSPLISAVIEAKCFDNMTVMIQREVARRICASPSTADYGAFTIYVNFFANPTVLFDVTPSSFIPEPKVWSSVVLLKKRTSPPAEIKNEGLFFKVVKSSFAQRRKTLVNGLHASFGDKLSKSQITEIVTSCGFPDNIRGEALDIKGFAKITNNLEGKLFM